MSPCKKLMEQQGRYSGTTVIYARYSSHNQKEASIEQQDKSIIWTKNAGSNSVVQHLFWGTVLNSRFDLECLVQIPI